MHIMSISVTFFPSQMYNLTIEWLSNGINALLLNMYTTAIPDNDDVIKY